tara:strand:+ start:1931 stop:2242 length:312 start_codon:yes stop_codon:yes gene_type:complete
VYQQNTTIASIKETVPQARVWVPSGLADPEAKNPITRAGWSRKQKFMVFLLVLSILFASYQTMRVLERTNPGSQIYKKVVSIGHRIVLVGQKLAGTYEPSRRN